MPSANAAPAVQWSSRIGFILAASGSAIGLGAIWKFPYWAGANGGAAFIVPYILFSLTSGLALVMAEIAIGRRGRGSAVTAMRRTGGPVFAVIGGFAVLTSFLILSYYSVVGGWCVAYLADALRGAVVSSDAWALRDRFGTLVSTGWLNIAWLLAFLTLTCATVALGVERGIERLSKILMPLLFVLMLILTGAGLSLDGALTGVRYLLDFSWDAVTPQSILSAMGFCFFSLSLGAGILVTYGAYLPERVSIPSASLWIVGLSLEASLLAGLMTMPAVFALGLEPDAGPGLVFLTVPMIFAHIPAGELLAALFYVSLLVAALTSSVSLLEVSVAFLKTECRLPRRAATFVAWGTLLLLGSVSALSFGGSESLTVFGRGFFDWLDFVCTNLLMPAGGLAVAALAGWRAWGGIREELVSARPWSEGALRFMRLLIAVIAPLLVLTSCGQGLLG